MRKRILAGLLTVALALSLLPVSALASTTLHPRPDHDLPVARYGLSAAAAFPSKAI